MNLGVWEWVRVRVINLDWKLILTEVRSLTPKLLISELILSCVINGSNAIKFVLLVVDHTKGSNLLHLSVESLTANYST